MTTLFLLPSLFRTVGLILLPLFGYLIAADVSLLLFKHRPVQTGFLVDDNASLEVWMLGMVLSLLFIAFFRLRTEDEYTAHLRLRALIQSVYINFGVAVVLIIFTHGLAFLLYAAMHSLTLLLLFSVLFYGRLLQRTNHYTDPA